MIKFYKSRGILFDNDDGKFYACGEVTEAIARSTSEELVADLDQMDKLKTFDLMDVEKSRKGEMKNRPVTVKKYDTTAKRLPNGHYPQIDSYKGWFHAWGYEYEEFENGPALFTVAIVEKPCGNIAIELPIHIRFTDGLTNQRRTG